MKKIEIKRLRDWKIKQVVISPFGKGGGAPIRRMGRGIFFLAFFIFSAFAGSPGSSALNFLKIPMGVRAVGMGEAYCGLAEGLDAVYYNPAGISQAGYQEFYASHIKWFDDIGYSFIGYIHPAGSLGSFAGSLYYLSKDNIPGYDNSGQPTNKKWDVSDKMCILSYGRKLKAVSGGINIKVIQETLADENTSAYCFDIGLLYGLFSDMNFGISAGNIGGKVQYISDTEEIPLILRTGISYRTFPFGDDITLNLDYNLPKDNDGYFCGGCEYFFSDSFTLRAGFVGTKHMISKALRFGFGFGKRNVHFDYAFAPSGFLENTHRLGLTIRFGRSFRRELVTGSAQRCREGEKYFRKGYLSKAANEFNAVLKLEPENRRAKDGILKIKAELADIKHSEKIGKHLKAGKKYYGDSKLKEAKKEFKKVIDILPEHQKANAYIARIDRDIKNAEIAGTVRQLLKAGKQAFLSGELEKAEKEFQKALGISPDNHEAKDYIKKIELKKEIAEKKEIPVPEAGEFGKITTVDFNKKENKTFISFVAPGEITVKRIKVVMYGKEIIAEGEIVECTDKTDKEFFYDAVLTKKNKEINVGDSVSWQESLPVPASPPGSRPSVVAEAEKTPVAGIPGEITDRSFNKKDKKTFISFVTPSEITVKRIKVMRNGKIIAEGEIIECTDKTDKEFFYDAVLTKEIKKVKKGSQVLISENAKEEGYYFNKATQLFQQGKYKEAIKEWQKVLEINPEHQLSKDKIKKTEKKLQK